MILTLLVGVAAILVAVFVGGLLGVVVALRIRGIVGILGIQKILGLLIGRGGLRVGIAGIERVLLHVQTLGLILRELREADRRRNRRRS